MSLDVYLICPHCKTTAFTANITHNLRDMADAVGILHYLWHPKSVDIKVAKGMIPKLTNALKDLKDNPQKYKNFNPPNGWGTYDGFVNFVSNYLTACKEYPECLVDVSA